MAWAFLSLIKCYRTPVKRSIFAVCGLFLHVASLVQDVTISCISAFALYCTQTTRSYSNPGNTVIPIFGGRSTDLQVFIVLTDNTLTVAP
mgnify:CR=1 FL=1